MDSDAQLGFAPKPAQRNASTRLPSMSATTLRSARRYTQQTLRSEGRGRALCPPGAN